MSARYGGYFGPSILNPGDIMRALAKLDLMTDIVIPGHDPDEGTARRLRSGGAMVRPSFDASQRGLSWVPRPIL
jgi:hypothetical protein